MDDALHDDLGALVDGIPEGWSRVMIDGQSWAVTRTTHAQGGALSLDIERLGTAERFGANVWITSQGPVLRPCEVPEEMILRFLRSAAAADH